MPADRGETRGERGDDGAAPPFLSWPAIYLVVLGALVAQVVLAAIVSAHFQ